MPFPVFALAQLLQKFARNHETAKGRKDDTNIHVLNWEDRLGSPKSIYFSNQKWASNKSNSSVISSCASCGVVWSHKVRTLSTLSHCKLGFSKCTDSARLRQDSAAKDIKTAQNCGKTEVLHLQSSYGICWSHEIETLPQCKQRIHPVLNIYYYSLTG